MKNIVGRIVDGIVTTGYQVMDEDGKMKNYKESDVADMIVRKEIGNAEVALDIDNLELRVEPTDNSVEKVNIKGGKIYTLACRILKPSGEDAINGKIKTTLDGYVVKDENGEGYRVSKNKIWVMALRGQIDGVEARIVNNVKEIRFKDRDKKLGELTIIVDRG